MALFEKKYCEICGEKAGLLSRTGIDGGYLCGECRKKLSEFSGNFKSKTVEDIKEEMNYREENKKLFEQFRETDSVGEHNEILIDADHGWWVLSDSGDYSDGNPDVFRYDEYIRTDVREDFRTIQDDNNDPDRRMPPREVLENLYFDIYVDHPYVGVVTFNLLSEFSPTPRRIDEAYRSAHDIEYFFRRLKADAVTIRREVEPVAQTDADSDKAISEIMKFKKLLDAGVLTEDEFTAKKKQILGI